MWYCKHCVITKHAFVHFFRFWRADIQGSKTGKLAGKKVAIKDNVAVAGLPMAVGCAALEGYIPEYDATVVTRILDEGETNVLLVSGRYCSTLSHMWGMKD